MMKKNESDNLPKISGLKIFGVSLLIFALCIILIKIVDKLFHTPGTEITAIYTISAGDVLAYLGGVIAAIVTGILSYLVFKIEEKNSKMEVEKNLCFLDLCNFNEEMTAFEFRDNYQQVLENPVQGDFAVALPNDGIFVPAILAVNKESNGIHKYGMKHYIMEFMYTGATWCKEVEITTVKFYSSTSKVILEKDIHYKYPIILSNKDTVRFYLFYASKNLSEITNGKLEISYTFTALSGTKRECTVELQKKEIEIDINKPELQRKGRLEVLKRKKYLKEPVM